MKTCLTVALSLVLLVSVADSAGAAMGSCVGVLAPGSYANIHVPAGAQCILSSGTAINGNVDVKGSLRAQAVIIGGNVTKDGPGFLTLVGSSVKGNVEVRGARILVAYYSINGNLTVESAWGGDIVANVLGGNMEIKKNNALLTISGNTIGGNLNVEGNSAQVDISGNRISGNVDCKNNALPPKGWGNAVTGNHSGQCAPF